MLVCKEIVQLKHGKDPIPQNLHSLYTQEEQFRGKALEIIAADSRLRLHISVVEAAMEIADVFRQCPTNDENLKVVKILSMRMFNAFGASLKLALSGYHQNCALILRDVLETVFLLDFFSEDHSQIEVWRSADEKSRLKYFSPVKVRTALDERDGFTSKRRADLYRSFSELAGHPTMKSTLMMSPKKGGDAVIGPFMEATTLDAVISEMGRLAIQSGQHTSAFIPKEWDIGKAVIKEFADASHEWIATFYPTASSK